MKQHILFIIDGLPGGGAENITLTLAKGFSERGFTVSLISLSNRLDYDIPSGINYLVDPDENKGVFRKINELSRRAHSLEKKLRCLLQEKGRPVLVISNLHKTDRIVSRAKILRDCNLWYCIHGMFSHSYLANKTGLKRWLKAKKIRKVYSNSNIIGVSKAVGQDLIEQLNIKPKQLITIYNPFNINEIKHRASQDNPYATESYILHVGRFHPVKRHDRLLEAFALADLPCKLILVGQGEDSITASIIEKISILKLQEKVILAGFNKNPLPIIKGAKLVVLSSDSEGLPTVLIEALICSTPIVSTNCPGGVSDIMSEKLVCYKSELTPQSLAEKIRLSYYDKPEITEDMYSKFDYESVIDQYISLIKFDKTALSHN